MNNKAKRIEDLDYTLVDKTGTVKKIKWGDNYYKWPIEQRLEYAESVAAVMNEAADKMQQERNAKLDEIALLTKKLEYAEQQIFQQKKILTDHITQNNEVKEQKNQIIIALQAKLKELKSQIDNRENE